MAADGTPNGSKRQLTKCINGQASTIAEIESGNQPPRQTPQINPFELDGSGECAERNAASRQRCFPGSEKGFGVTALSQPPRPSACVH